MNSHDMPMLRLTAGAVVAFGLWTAPAAGSQQSTPAAATSAIEEHLDEADDLLETLLDWRRAITATSVGDDRRTPPTAPMPTHTLIPLDRQQVEKLTQLIDAVAGMVPRSTAPAAPRGDMRAHAEKAQQIARDLLPAPGRPVGTSGSTGSVAMVDRAALQRLEIEVEAMEMLARVSRVQHDQGN
jgi:hypothetical protein